MWNPEKTAIILNPAAQGGRVGRRWASVYAAHQAILGGTTVLPTTPEARGAVQTRRALETGRFDTLLAVGGDGTFHEVVNGLWDGQEGVADIRLGLLPMGTGGDFRRLLCGGAGADLAQRIARLPQAAEHRMDLGWCTYVDDEGQPGREAFLNVASFGAGGLVDREVNKSRKRLPGWLAFGTAMWKVVRAYRPPVVRLSDETEEVFFEGSILNVALGNGQYYAAGFHVAPRALLDDGLLEVVVLQPGTLPELIVGAARKRRGAHLDHALVRYRRVRTLRAEIVGEGSAYLDLDGEAPGMVPASFGVLSRALSVLDLDPRHLSCSQVPA